MEFEKLELEPRQDHERLQHVVASIPAMLFTIAIDGEHVTRVSWISENSEQILGYKPAQATEWDWWLSHMHPDDREAALTEVRTSLFEHGEARQEFRFQHADGRWGWTASRLRLIRD